MIPIAKGPTPAILEQRGDEWTAELLAVIAANDDSKSKRKSRYNHPQVKAALIEETHGKCAYCESKVLHITYGDIEHIIPKSPHPEVTYVWANLTLACDKCNTNKGEVENLADPYSDPVDQFFHFAAHWMFHAPGNERAQFTLLTLQLNRPDLVERRKDEIDAIHRRVTEIQKTSTEELRRLLIQALLDDARNAKNEYAACATAFVEHLSAKGYLPVGIV